MGMSQSQTYVFPVFSWSSLLLVPTAVSPRYSPAGTPPLVFQRTLRKRDATNLLWGRLSIGLQGTAEQPIVEAFHC